MVVDLVTAGCRRVAAQAWSWNVASATTSAPGACLVADDCLARSMNGTKAVTSLHSSLPFPTNRFIKTQRLLVLLHVEGDTSGNNQTLLCA